MGKEAALEAFQFLSSLQDLQPIIPGGMSGSAVPVMQMIDAVLQASEMVAQGIWPKKSQ